MVRKLFPTVFYGCSMGVEFRCIAVEINKDDTHKAGATNRLQAVVSAIKPLNRVHASATDVRGGAKCPCRCIPPAVVGAPNCACKGSGLGDEWHTAVTADIVEYPDLIICTAHGYQWQPHEINRVCKIWLRQFAFKDQPCPSFRQHLVSFKSEKLLGMISGVWHPTRRTYIGHHFVERLDRNQVIWHDKKS